MGKSLESIIANIYVGIQLSTREHVCVAILARVSIPVWYTVQVEVDDKICEPVYLSIREAIRNAVQLKFR